VSRARTHVWYDGVWPVATGLVTGLGLVAAYLWTGPVMFAVALVALIATAAPVAWSLLSELGFGVRRIVLRVAPATSVGLLALIGLSELIEGWTFLVVGVVVVTSPLLEGWSRVGIRGVLADRMSARSQTRRQFDEIVSHGFGTTDEDPTP
jgi:hypothetical protein